MPLGFAVFLTGGRVNRNVPPLTPPIWDTSWFVALSGGAVPVYHLPGPATYKDKTYNGIVVVNMIAGKKVTFDDCVINGVLVVHAPYSAAAFPATPPNELDLKDIVTINSGTPLTGNLALLAPGCEVTLNETASR